MFTYLWKVFLDVVSFGWYLCVGCCYQMGWYRMGHNMTGWDGLLGGRITFYQIVHVPIYGVP